MPVLENVALWEIAAVREHILTRTQEAPLQASLDVLRQAGGDTGRSLAEAFETLPYREGHWIVRALLRDSAGLKEHDYSFRRWLKGTCHSLGVDSFPPRDFRQPVALGSRELSLEEPLRVLLAKIFDMVGPALAAYMLCDWQLWLWHQSQTTVFANFKLDSFHQDFAARHGKGVIPGDEDGFADWWLSRYPELPPRLANECIWLGVQHGDV